MIVLGYLRNKASVHPFDLPFLSSTSLLISLFLPSHLISSPLLFLTSLEFLRRATPDTEAFMVKRNKKKTRKPSVARKPRDVAAVLFGLKFADHIHYKFKTSQASKARLQSSKHTSAKQNLTQNGHSRSFKVKVTCFAVSRKAIRD